MKKRICFTGFSHLIAVLIIMIGSLIPQRTASAHPHSTTPSDPATVAEFFDGIVPQQLADNHIPGAVVTVVQNGQVIFSKGYGFANVEEQLPFNPQWTVFRIGSITKLFTWTAVMQLAEQGKLDLEADINTYLDFQIPDTFPEPITMKDLLSHTPGFEDQANDQAKTRAEDMISLDQYLKKHVPARVFPPGKIGAYSNYGGALAGYIVERISGIPFAEYVEKKVFTPLGMTRSTLRQPLPAGLESDLTNGYYYTQGAYVKGGFEYVIPYPAGAISSTAADMAQFMLAHLQNGRLGDARILSEQPARRMHSQLFTHDPRMTGMAYGFFEARVNGQRILWHGGDTILLHSGLFLIPDQNTGIFVGTNGAAGGVIPLVLINNYLDHFYPAEPEPVPTITPSADFASRMRPYLGTYYIARRNFTTYEKLLFGMGGMPPVTVSLDAQGNLIFSSAGLMAKMVETEPGLFIDPNEADSAYVLRTDESGQAYLLVPEPLAYMRVPWYGTLNFRDLLVQFALLLFLGSSIGWGIAALVRLRKRKSRPFLSRLARWVGALFGLVLIVFCAGLIYMLSMIDPAIGAQVIHFYKPPLFYLLMALPYLLAGLGLLMLIFTFIAWARRYWNWASNLHYTLLTLSGLSVVWMMWYWNLLF